MRAAQEQLCYRVGAEFRFSPPGLKVGLAMHTLGQRPINGLRHLPASDTTGWYLWGGETIGQTPDFFEPVHVAHLDEILPEVVPYLGLAPGWRFMLAEGHEDVWFDPALLAVE
jgi:hypothetical protein